MDQAKEIKIKKKKYKEIEVQDILGKINNKLGKINQINKRLAKVKVEVTKKEKKVELIYEAMCEQQDEIYSDDSRLRIVELDKIDAIIDEAFNVVWTEICKENRISTEKINQDEHKDNDA